MKQFTLKLLVSPLNEKEALEAIAGGADIIDVKNPKEGALGASFPWVIKRVREITPEPIEVSCTLGDLPNLPGSVALAAYGASLTGVDYVKCSMYNVKTKEDAIFLMKSVVRAIREHRPKTRVVAVGFADAHRIGSVEPSLVPLIAHESGADVAMLDTALKNGNSLLSFLNRNALKAFVDESHKHELKAALAGSVKKEELHILSELGVDIIGIRGAACSNQDRVNGQILREKVAELAAIVRIQRQKGKKSS